MTPVSFFDDYDRVEDTLIQFGNGVSITFCVNLFTKDYKNPNYSKCNINIYQYESKQVNRGMSTNVYRNLNYYMAIKVRDNFDSSVMIPATDMIKFRILINQAEKLFDAFRINNGVLEMKTVPPYKENVGGRMLQFHAQKYIYKDGYEVPGLVWEISKDTRVGMDINKYYELKYLVDGFNMYQSATTMLNFLTFSRRDANKLLEDKENNKRF